MHARKGAAGNGDEQEREELAGEYRARGGQSEFGDRGHLHDWANEHNAEGEYADSADLHEGGQVVARSEQYPDGKNCR